MKLVSFLCSICLNIFWLSAQTVERPVSTIADTSVTGTVTNPTSITTSVGTQGNDNSQDNSTQSQPDSIADTTWESVNADDEYEIPVFINDLHSFPQQPNKYIDAINDSSTLVMLDSFPDAFISQRLILRRRFGPEEYSMYLGIISDYAKTKQSNFFIFNIPESLTPASIAKLKLYDDKVENPNQDMENVYFDNKHIYVPKLSKIYYYHDSSWNMLPATNVIIIKKKTTGDISITSTPSGANVTVDGKDAGKITPYIAGTMKPGKHSVSIALKDYEKKTKEVDVKADTIVQVNFDLKSTIGLEHKFFVSLFFNPEYYFNISPTRSSDDNWKKGIQKDTTIERVSTPSNNFGAGVTLKAGYRLKNRLWLTGRVLYSNYKLGDYMIVRDTGIIDREYEKWQSSRTTSIFGIAPGIRYDAFRTPFYQLSFSVAPEYAYVIRNLHTTDSSFTESAIRSDSNIIAYRVYKTIINAKSKLTGSAFGGDVSIDSKIFVKRNLCIDIQFGFNSVIAPSLKGKRCYTYHDSYSSPVLNLPDLVSDTSWTENIAALRGNNYGTGNIIFYDNPDYYKDFKKAYIELTKILLRIGICFYF